MASPSPQRNGHTDSPNRQLLSEERRFRSRDRYNGTRSRSPDLDSPSRQIVEEFARLLVSTDRERREKLDEETAEKRKAHEAAISKARIEHDKIREAAVRLKQQLDFEAERIRHEEEEKSIRAWERAQAEKEAQETRTVRARQEALKAEEERQRQAERLKQESAEAEARAEQLKIDSQARLKKIDEAAKVKIQKEAEERARLDAEAKAKVPQVNGVAPASTARSAPVVVASTPAASRIPAAQANATDLPQSPVVISQGQRTAEHESYLAIHERLKRLRQMMKRQCREAKRTAPDSPLARVDDLRREVMKMLGQITNPSSQETKQNNLRVRARIKQILHDAFAINTPSVDIREYLLNPSTTTDPSTTQVSAIFIYLLNILVKQAIAQWVASASTTTYNPAEPIGVLVAAIIADPLLTWNGHPFASILLSKFHHSCPVLFGVYGRENTVQGRRRLGWRKAGEDDYVMAEDHYDRMRGLGAGWASITLRNFTRASMKNAFPNWHYWRAVACITNVPGELATPTHFVVLKALLDQGYAKAFVKFYGQAACVAIRRAIVDFPAQAPKSAQREGVRVLRDKFLDPEILGLEF